MTTPRLAHNNGYPLASETVEYMRERPLTRVQLDLTAGAEADKSVVIACIKCDRGSPGVVPVYIMGTGVIEFECSRCGKLVAVVKVASEP
jgi:hypothetical protein